MVAERIRACFLNSFLVAIFLAAGMGAQEFRGSISGQVTDPSGAVLPGAQVTVTNVATNTSSSMATNTAGNYTVLYLTAGQYRVSVEAPGFKKLVREGIEIRVGDQLKLDLALEVGSRHETLEVTGAAPVLETYTASGGQIYDAKLLSDLPIQDGNPLLLPRLAAGVTTTSPNLRSTRPFDNANTSALHGNGGLGSTDFTLDGTPDTSTGNVVGFVPPRDAVKELKVHTATFDASLGHTSDATIQMTTKNGTNQLHGTLYEFLRNDALAANDFFSIREGVPKAPLRYDLWGGSVGGPIVLPKIYNGRDRTFFFFDYEGIIDKYPQPTYGTLPTMTHRRGSTWRRQGGGLRF